MKSSGIGHHVDYLGEEKTLTHNAIQAQFGHLQGKVLTVLEAAIEGQKLEAVKGLVKKMFNEQQTYITELCYPEVRMLTQDEATAKVDIEEMNRQIGLQKRGAVDQGQ